ncbi:MAG: hypothetical protein ACRC7O_01330, partial [Fimbriiglobus sp.]
FLHIRKLVAGGIALAGLLAAVAVRGCPDTHGGTETIAGKVASGGKTVVSGTVTVLGSDNRVYQTPIRADGSYELTGVPTGPVRIAVTSTNAVATFNRAGASPAGLANSGTAPPPQNRASSQPPAAGDDAKSRPKTFGVEPSIAPGPPQPTAAPPANWFPIPGKYANPQSSGLTGKAGGGRTHLDISVD